MDPSSTPRTDISEFDGRALTDPERYRLEIGASVARRITELRSTLAAGRIDGAEAYREMAGLLRALTTELTTERPTRGLKRFGSELQLSDLRKGDPVVFMGIDPAVHGAGLLPVIEMFREERLTLGREYAIAQIPDVTRGRAFAITAPTGIRHLCYTYFGTREPRGEPFVTEWAMQ